MNGAWFFADMFYPAWDVLQAAVSALAHGDLSTIVRYL